MRQAWTQAAYRGCSERPRPPTRQSLTTYLNYKYFIAKNADHHLSLQLVVIFQLAEGLKYCGDYKNVTETSSSNGLVKIVRTDLHSAR